MSAYELSTTTVFECQVSGERKSLKNPLPTYPLSGEIWIGYAKRVVRQVKVPRVMEELLVNRTPLENNRAEENLEEKGKTSFYDLLLEIFSLNDDK